MQVCNSNEHCRSKNSDSQQSTQSHSLWSHSVIAKITSDLLIFGFELLIFFLFFKNSGHKTHTYFLLITKNHWLLISLLLFNIAPTTLLSCPATPSRKIKILQMQTSKSRIRSFVFLHSWETIVPPHQKMPGPRYISLTALLVKEWTQTQHFPYRIVTSGSSQAESNAWGRKPFSPLLAEAQQVETASEGKTLPSILFWRLLTPHEWLEAAQPFLTQHWNWPQRFAEKLQILLEADGCQQLLKHSLRWFWNHRKV